jgi:hypothetical protein
LLFIDKAFLVLFIIVLGFNINLLWVFFSLNFSKFLSGINELEQFLNSIKLSVRKLLWQDIKFQSVLNSFRHQDIDLSLNLVDIFFLDPVGNDFVQSEF